jgi:hypothetical protein
MPKIRKLKRIKGLIAEGQITLGMTRKQVYDLLGEADAQGYTTRKYKVTSIYKYGDVEFVFPPARSLSESEPQGLCYVYVDDGVKGVDEPIFILGPVSRTGSKQ